MHVFLGVENFAKIESARVCMDGYSLLVGPNNSGKTFLMQLIQGVNEKIISLIDKTVLSILEQDGERFSRITENDEGEHVRYIISKDNILQFAEYLNKRLDTEKEQIVKEIFGKEIPIRKLYIEIVLDVEERYEITISNNLKRIKKLMKLIWERQLEIPSFSPQNMIAGDLMKYDTKKPKGQLLRISISMPEFKTDTVISFLRDIFEYQSLFLPASRTGLMLLYRDFFANKADSVMSFEMREKKFIEDKNINGNLTQPIYQFLRVLQTYTESDDRKKEYKDEIDFFEKQLIEGHISAEKQNGFVYDSTTDNMSIPMYMASSMINEMVPIMLALTDKKSYGRLIIDEIEASLHPKKQLELVRFLNRLSNKGIKLILSTHSDTFASKMNNLYLLSEYVIQNRDYEIINKMGLQKEDLMDTKNLFVYEFINQPDGKSIVKNITGDKTTGYQFDLFADSAMHLFSESLQIGEILQNDKTAL